MIGRFGAWPAWAFMGLFFVLPLAALALEAFAEGGGRAAVRQSAAAWRLAQYARPGSHGGGVSALVGTAVAVELARQPERRRRWMIMLLGMPLAFSGLVIAYGFILGYGRAGFVTQLMAGAGADPPGRRLDLQRDRSGIRLCLLPGAARGLVAVPGFRQPGPAAHAGGAPWARRAGAPSATRCWRRWPRRCWPMPAWSRRLPWGPMARRCPGGHAAEYPAVDALCPDRRRRVGFRRGGGVVAAADGAVRRRHGRGRRACPAAPLKRLCNHGIPYPRDSKTWKEPSGHAVANSALGFLDGAVGRTSMRRAAPSASVGIIGPGDGDPRVCEAAQGGPRARAGRNEHRQWRAWRSHGGGFTRARATAAALPSACCPRMTIATPTNGSSVAVATGMGEMRNALVARSAVCLAAIGGNMGTLSEMALGLKWGRRCS